MTVSERDLIIRHGTSEPRATGQQFESVLRRSGCRNESGFRRGFESRSA
jgi:hypothetical protein